MRALIERLMALARLASRRYRAVNLGIHRARAHVGYIERMYAHEDRIEVLRHLQECRMIMKTECVALVISVWCEAPLKLYNVHVARDFF